MTIKEVLHRKGQRVITTTADETVLNAVKRMVDNRVGALLVVDSDGGPVGIFTERDVLRMVAVHHGRLDSFQVGEVMTGDLLVAIPADEVEAALSLMTEKRLRHLPVMEEGELAGIISIGDIVKAKLQDTAFEAHHLRDYIMGRY